MATDPHTHTHTQTHLATECPCGPTGTPGRCAATRPCVQDEGRSRPSLGKAAQALVLAWILRRGFSCGFGHRCWRGLRTWCWCLASCWAWILGPILGWIVFSPPLRTSFISFHLRSLQAAAEVSRQSDVLWPLNF